eukprot:4827666-Ditylum_brightwellii.AAC.1
MRKERHGREWDEDDNDGREYGSRKKARRLGSVWKVNETEISPQGFIDVLDQRGRGRLAG